MAITDNNFTINSFENPLPHDLINNFIATKSMAQKLQNITKACLDAHVKDNPESGTYNTELNKFDLSEGIENDAFEFLWYKAFEHLSIKLERIVSKRIGDYFMSTNTVTDHFNDVITTLHRYTENSIGAKTLIIDSVFQIYVGMRGTNVIKLYRDNEDLGTEITLQENDAVAFIPSDSTHVSIESTNSDLITVKFSILGN